MEKAIKKYEETENETSKKGKISLIPNQYGMSDDRSMEKIFSIPNRHGIKTLVYEIYVNIDYKSLTKYYDCELVDSTENQYDENTTVTTYFIDDPQGDGNQLIFLHFDTINNEVYVNTGLLINNSVKITKQPFPMKFSKASEIEGLHLNKSAYDYDTLEGCSKIDKYIYDEAEITNNPIIIIDPETAEPIKREVYYDENEKCYKAKIKVIPSKSYFSFQIRDDDGLVYIPLTAIEKAKYYRKGDMAFPKDVELAAKLIEEDGSAEAFYEAARIFIEDDDMQDNEMYIEYLQRAVDLNESNAQVELALWKYLHRDKYSTDDVHSLLKKASESYSEIGMFIYAYCLEKGLLGEKDINKAFELYYNAAKKNIQSGTCKIRL